MAADSDPVHIDPSVYDGMALLMGRLDSYREALSDARAPLEQMLAVCARIRITGTWNPRQGLGVPITATAVTRWEHLIRAAIGLRDVGKDIPR